MADRRGAHTERQLDGHKITVTQQGESIVLHAYTDGRPVTRLIYDLNIVDAYEIGRDLLDAVKAVQSATSQTAVHVSNTEQAERDIGPE